MNGFISMLVGVLVWATLLSVYDAKNKVIEAIEENSVEESLSSDYDYTLQLEGSVIIVRDGTDVYIVQPDSLEEFIIKDNL